MKTVTSFTNQADAGLAVSFLQANGVDAVLLDENSFLGAYGGPAVSIRLQVPEEEEAQAVSLLETMKDMRESDTGLGD